jgi:uncharacterized protein YdhG (YjbR/CyaY superfamily)
MTEAIHLRAASKKKARPARSKSPAKDNSGAKDVDKYLAAVPEPARTTLNKVRAVIKSAAPPEATEAISYGIPAFKYNGLLVAYAAFAKHCSFFPASGSLLKEFEEDLKGFPCSKGTIRFAPDKPLPAALIEKLVKARVAKSENKGKR